MCQGTVLTLSVLVPVEATVVLAALSYALATGSGGVNGQMMQTVGQHRHRQYADHLYDWYNIMLLHNFELLIVTTFSVFLSLNHDLATVHDIQTFLGGLAVDSAALQVISIILY